MDENLTPIHRIEYFLDAIVNGAQNPFEPIHRIEYFLAKIAGANVVTPTPIYRIEKYLAKIAGDDVEIPYPLFRTEKYLAKIAGEDIETPEPFFRIEYWLAQWAEQGGGEIVSVRGVSPLTLLNAVAGKIKSLIQYGKVSTSGDVITCNNGTLTLVDDELPLGYKRITGMKFDGDTWYDTGEVLTGDDDVTMTLANTATGGQNIFGSYNGTGSGTKNFSLYLYGGGSTSNCYFRYGSQLVRPRFGSNQHTITFGKSGTSGFDTDVSVTPDEFTTEATAYIGMLPNSTSPAYTGSIIGNILVGDRLKYIPCERVSDGVVGYYETHTETFLEPSGTGSVTKGEYDTSHCTVVSAEGTAEEVTVTGENLFSKDATPLVNNAYIKSPTTGQQIITQSNSNYKVFQIPVVAETQYTFGLVKATDPSWCFVDANGVILYGGLNSGGTAGRSITYTAPVNSAYLLLSVAVGGTYKFDDTLMLVVGASLPTEYVPYSSQTVSDIPNLYAVDSLTDEHDIITGKTIRRTEAVVENGEIVIRPLATPVEEQHTPHPLTVEWGTNTVSWTANVTGKEMEATYKSVEVDSNIGTARINLSVIGE